MRWSQWFRPDRKIRSSGCTTLTGVQPVRSPLVMATISILAWSPDSQRVAFCSTRGDAQEDIYVKPVGGGSSEQLLLGGEGNKEPDRWSADGRYIIYDNIGNRATGTDVWALPTFGDRKPFPVVQTPATDFYGNLSPDGKWAAYESDESGRGEIYLVPFPGPGANGRSPPVVVLRPYGRRATNYFMKPAMPSSWLSNSPPVARISSSASPGCFLVGVPWRVLTESM
jgi:dipeptidyl aminopeptidase/acylaminoacyl peptidase